MDMPLFNEGSKFSDQHNVCSVLRFESLRKAQRPRQHQVFKDCAEHHIMLGIFY